MKRPRAVRPALDGNGVVGEMRRGFVSGRSAVVGGSENDGAPKVDEVGVGSIGGLIEFDRSAGGEATKRGDNTGCEIVGIIEG